MSAERHRAALVKFGMLFVFAAWLAFLLAAGMVFLYGLRWIVQNHSWAVLPGIITIGVAVAYAECYLATEE